MPLVSVIIPVYKVENELRRCVNSVLSQTLTDIEIILVDDGSPDGCPQICDDYADRDSRVKVIHKVNGGLSDARNYGLNKAAGDYVMFVDSDDYIEVDSCERLYLTAVASDADMVLGDWRISPGQDNPDHYALLEEGRVYSASDFILTALKAGEWYPCACFMFCKLSLFNDNNLRFAVGLLHEDMEMQPRVFLAARSIVCVKYKFYNYIMRPGSIMKSSNCQKRAVSMQEILGRWKRQFDNIENSELRDALYGYLAKCYLHTCRDLGLRRGLSVPGIDKRFLFEHGASQKEKAKALLFAASPRFYSYL
ncbi:glycosyltransferase family 2 protein [Collinsella intestinalis]|uniref:glycosyltransferase family 2 protein n=1 Tax=Collinsella intestinalis TaxID=147207 RepID=UPI0015FAC047|nr:glycosyltransferase family 2 protein [Collinsella intestinalis]